MRFPGFEGEWEVKKLGEITSWSSGGTPPKDNPLFWNGDITWISASSMKGLVYSNSELKITQAGLKKGSKLASKGSLLILVRGSMLFNKIPIGIVSKDVAFNQDVKSIVVNDCSTSEYILNWFISSEPKILNMVTGTGIGAGKLDLQDLKELEIKIPSIPEQIKITSFLSIIDERIQTQNKIIEELKLLKNTLSKKIFSGQLKFKDERGNDFPERKIKKLGDVFYSEKGKGISKNKIDANGKYGCVLYGELYTRYNEVIFDIVSKTNEEDGLKSQVGDLLIPSSTTTTGIDLANVTAINKENVLLGGDITVLRTKEKINNIFYAYYLSNHKKEEIASYAQGSTIVHLYYSHIKEMLIDIPSLQEQTRIALFLTSIDTKIDVEYQLLQELKEQKKYFLANLLI